VSVFETLFKYPALDYGAGRLVFLSRIPGEVRLLLLAGLIALAWVLYRRVAGRTPRRANRALLGLRMAIGVILVFMLGIPALRFRSPRPSGVFTAVMLDTSRSMSIEDVRRQGGKASRLAAAKNLLLASGTPDDPGILLALERSSNLLVYAFDAQASRVTDVEPLKAQGQHTNLFRSIRDLDAELRSVPLAAVVMLTDGCRNLGGDPVEAARLLEARGVPLYVVGLGNPSPPKDYEVMQVYAPRRVRRNTEVEVLATIRHTDYDQPFEIRISRGDTPLVSKKVEPAKGTDLTSLRIAFTPDHEGTATYRLSVPPAPGESITDNNSREFSIHIQDDRLPVLYIEGSPRLEYRFLRRALFRDHDFRVVGLLRLASDRFYVQGANEAEAYLEKGFPETREQLFAFEAVILGDIEASHFTKAQLELLEDFVRERGGGLLMLGGVNSFGLGKYAGTPVGKMLPLEISPADPAYSDERYKAVVTPEGLKHPVMRLLPDADANRRLWEKAPELIGITPVRGVKPGATLLLASENGSRPVLAAQPYGLGRVAAFTSGGSWYWQVSLPADDAFHEKFWKQLIRWLAVGAKEQLTAETDADTYSRRSPVYIRATVLGKDLRPVNDATVIAAVSDPLGNKEEIPMDWVLTQEGVYQARYVPADEGEYQIAVRVEGWKVQPAVAGFLVGEPIVEFTDAGLKEELLRQMAATTKGRYFTLADAAELPKAVEAAIRTARLAGVKPHDQEIWDAPFLFLLLLGIMGSEWFIRRRSGLA